MNATRETDIVELGDGNEYTVSALGLMELESLETFIQGKVIQAGRESIPADTPSAVQEEMMQPVIAYAMNLSITDDSGYAKLMNFSGMTRLIYYSLKRAHPDIKLEKCRDFVSDAPVMKKFLDAITRVNKLSNEPAQKHLDGPPESEADRPLPSSGGPKSDVRNATKRNRRAQLKPTGSVSQSNGLG